MGGGKREAEANGVWETGTGGGNTGSGDQRRMERKEITGLKEDDTGFSRVLTSRERESARKIQAAEKAAAESLRAKGAPKMGGRNPGEFSTVFERTGGDSTSFLQEHFISVYLAIKEMMPNAFPRITNKGGRLEIWVHTREENEKVKNWTELGDVGVRACPNGEVYMWGRIENVHYQFSEETIMSFLAKQGVAKVRRVQYTRHLAGADSLKAIKVNTDKVDIQFAGEIKKQVTIGSEAFDVTLVAPAPIQCTKCLKFSHKKDECSAQELTCATCGQSGHVTTSCKNAPCCVNCKLRHHALSTRCPVYQAWANAARRKYENKVMESTKGTIVDRKEVPPAHQATTSLAPRAPVLETGCSFADKVAARELVVHNDDGSQEVICKVQVSATHAKKSLQKRRNSTLEKARLERTKTIETAKESKGPKPDKEHTKRAEKLDKNVEELNGKAYSERKRQEKLEKLWEKGLTFLKSLTSKYPEIALLIIILEEAAELILPQQL